MKKILFVCTANLDRSPTAEKMYQKVKGLDVKSAGIHGSSQCILTGDLLEWADLILVMEDHHKEYIINWMPEIAQKIIVLGIPNNYLFDETNLKKQIRSKVDPILF